MGRVKREISESGIYLVYFCGINKQNIFCEDSDFEFFKAVIERNKSELSLFAFCFTKKSVNLLVKETNSTVLPQVMQKILTTYASYFNKKYSRSGSLFENRYKSMPIKNDEVFEAINFVHKLPKNYETYKWSSFLDNGLCDVDFSADFKEIHKTAPDKGFDLSDADSVKDRRLLIHIKELLGDLEIEEIKGLSKPERDAVLKMLRENGFTIGQLMRLTGVSRSIVTRSTEEKSEKKEDKKEMQIFLL